MSRLLFLIIAVFPYFSYAQMEISFTPADKKAYLEAGKKRAEDKLKTKTTWRFETFQGQVTSNKYKSEILYFDKLGRISQWENYNVNGKLETLVEMTYDQNNNLVKESEYFATGHLLYKTLFNYDKDGFITSQIFYYGENDPRVKISYSKGNNTLSEYKYYPIESLKSIRTHYYTDNFRQLNKTEVFGADSAMSYYIEYNYKDDILAQEVYYSPSKKFIYKIDYTNQNGVPIAVTKHTNMGEDQYVKTYKYNSSNRPTQFIEKGKGGQIERVLEYSYEYFE